MPYIYFKHIMDYLFTWENTLMRFYQSIWEQDLLGRDWWTPEAAAPISILEEEERGSENNISAIYLVR